MKWFDDFFERRTRDVARFTSRRNALVRLGRIVVGAGLVFPVLPFDRSPQNARAFEASKDAKEDTSCEYWRYCALDGFLCTCCGGSVSQCPPGSEVSSVTWVGTCQNPDDGKAYLVSYNDCCGLTSCGRCLCNYNQGERPAYRMGVHNDVNWCMGNKVNAYHCTVSVILGVTQQPAG